MEGSNYGENVRPVRARKKGRKIRTHEQYSLGIDDTTALIL